MISHSYEKYVQAAVASQRAWHSSGESMPGSMVSSPLYQPGAGQSALSA